MKMDNLFKDNKGGLNVLNVNVDMMTDDEKTLYISGYEKRIKEMRTAYISTGCLVISGGFFVLWMNLD